MKKPYKEALAEINQWRKDISEWTPKSSWVADSLRPHYYALADIAEQQLELLVRLRAWPA